MSRYTAPLSFDFEGTLERPDRGGVRVFDFQSSTKEVDPSATGREQALSVSSDAAVTFDNVYCTQFVYVCRSLRRLGLAPGDLEDAAQDVFVDVYRKFSSYDPSRPIKPWLFGYIYHTYLSRTRSLKIRDRLFAPFRIWASETAVDPHHPYEQLERKQGEEVLYHLIAQLSPSLRAVFILHDIDGCAVSEIAEALEIPLNTAYSRLRLARESFESHLSAMKKRGEWP